jgi:hypothetical protein
MELCTIVEKVEHIVLKLSDCASSHTIDTNYYLIDEDSQELMR